MLSCSTVDAMTDFQIISHTPAETADVAGRLSQLLRAGDVLLLSGDLGAGKTFFAQAVARGLGVEDAATSPTFPIANILPTPNGALLHIDAYRLGGVAEFRDLGLEDDFDEAVTIIEWGERLSSEFDAYLSLQIDFGDESTARELRFGGFGDRGMHLLARLQAQLAKGPA
ncbi:MAG: tRNA (adenosine(37)-N6)-threonylcarbamoyltransferase complex ATPase subunit type 1 TsaE [Pseudomonadota bacterium]